MRVDQLVSVTGPEDRRWFETYKVRRQPNLLISTAMDDNMRIACSTLLVLLFMFAVAIAPSAHARELSQEQHCLALAMYWEARGEGREGMEAVGWTVLNRAHNEQFPSTLCGVVQQGGEKPPCQFSWWCDGKSDRPRDADLWEQAQAVAVSLDTDPPTDPTKGALFFHNSSIAVPWKKPRERTARIGSHIFYR